MRNALVATLSSCGGSPCNSQARRFLSGLSSDELQFIAEFLGACALESEEQSRCSRTQLAENIAEFQSARGSGCSRDQDHKMILLLEYLCRDGRQFTLARAAHA